MDIYLSLYSIAQSKKFFGGEIKNTKKLVRKSDLSSNTQTGLLIFYHFAGLPEHRFRQARLV